MNEEEIAVMQEENAALKESTDSMQSKMNELLGEAKKAKTERKAAEETARIAAEESAKQSGDYEQMFKSSEEQRTALQANLDGLRGAMANEKRNAAAQSVALELADGSNAELLAAFIAPRLKYSDDGVKVLDSAGQVTVSTTADLAAEFKNNAKYSSLLKGNQSSGGSAPGGDQTGSAGDKTLTRGEFDNLTPFKKMEFIKSGGTTVD